MKTLQLCCKEHHLEGFQWPDLDMDGLDLGGGDSSARGGVLE